ncbi:MAG TPA: PA domain-containing protein [Pyrinomonadaceae bacterium]|nr:PA domain-containing protein [Pyrinomonadaceae bacterium]
MRTLLILLLQAFLFTSVVLSQVPDNRPLDGFTTEHVAAERRWEEQFRTVPSPASAREHLRRLTLEPHVAGTKEDYATAVYVRDQLRSYGLNADIREYQVWMNYPNAPTLLELLTTNESGTATHHQILNTREAVVPGDPTSSNPKITPLFNGYSASGDVTAPVVYANYGLPNDYEELQKAGVDVKGKIVIVRYGNSFRGVKAKVAQDHGAVGCIIYSDPADDGYMQGDVYPKGPWRPVASGQRGSVQYLFDYPGDPLTPGRPAIEGVPRLKPEEATDLTRIPVQPIAYDVARQIIAPLK